MQRRQQQAQRMLLQRQEQQVLLQRLQVREQRQVQVPEQERVLPSCHKRPEQQQRSQRPIREFCSFVFT